mmetsp:Transcript_31511/g.57262  ORF Transcript_31511/g.57262 Transcript_31511/m.57262 type:complete len:659 (-) Transcript_31511:106-2082(-)
MEGLGVEGMLTPQEIGLDERAAEFVQKLPPEKMQEILKRVASDSSIRSPSAYVTKMAKEALADQQADAALAANWLSPEHFELDERSSDFLRQLQPNQMQEILEKLHANLDSIRSPSAFVTKMCKEARDANNSPRWAAQQPQLHDPWGKGGDGPWGKGGDGSWGKGGAAPWAGKMGPPMYQGSAAPVGVEQMGLDDNAADFLRKLPPGPRQDILRRLQNEWQNIRSPSAFATKLAKEVMNGIESAGGLLSPQQFGLDERCTDFLQQLPPQQQQEVLQRLQAEWDSVRSPSALVTRMVKEILSAGISNAPPMPDFDRPRPKGAAKKPQDASETLPLVPSQLPPGLDEPLIPEDHGLDAEASDFLRKLPPEKMQEILLKLEAQADQVRNPSGLATRLAKQAEAELGLNLGPSPMGGSMQTHGGELLDDLGAAPELTAEQFDLDAEATDFLSKIPPHLKQQVLSTFEKESAKTPIRSPSAFVTRLAKESVRRSGIVPGNRYTAPQAAAQGGPALSPEQFGLDESASDYVQQLPAHEMQEVLERLKADWQNVRSPSAYVTRMVKERIGKGSGKNPRLFAAGKAGPSSTFGDSGGEPLTPEQFDLDEQASDFLRKLQPSEMQEILTTLKEELGTVRSPSAFVTRLAKQTLSASMEGRSSRYSPY